MEERRGRGTSCGGKGEVFMAERREAKTSKITHLEWLGVPGGPRIPLREECAQGGIRHCDQQGKKRFHVVILARAASATHKPLIATAKRKLADMELAEITDHRFMGRNVIFRGIVKLGESGWQADKAVVQQSPKTETSHSTLT